MSWDPEIDDALIARRRLAEAAATLGEPIELPAEPGAGAAPAPEPPPRDPLAPIDPNAPVSGHRPAPEPGTSVADSPEHDWAHAAALVFPSLRPVGTQGLPLAGLSSDRLSAEGQKSHSQPIVDAGPCELAIVYALTAGGFDVLVNADHLLTWGVGGEAVRAAALGNLAAWSADAGWSDEESGGRHIVSSATGDGWDAARILLPEVRGRLRAQLGADGARVLVGLPERHLLVAGALRADDPEFAGLLAEFVAEQSAGADEPIDGRLFELVDDGLVAFAA